MPNYVGFLRGTGEAQSDLSPEELQHTLERYMAWSEKLAAEGNPPTGGGLSTSKSRVLRRDANGLSVTAGPFVEATEILGGYITIEAADLDEAEQLFSTHPHLDFGSIEVRKVGERGCEA
ncbi:hypothetical protein EV193_105309 [Herbihabitans rhizosphaerae]|uniref:YCII-related domain-containing protein n=1 Tax=Herbihabitans rhizosphaerae TaxID=1872711 RepID=A0A4Q7KPX7_9PSEU|nr:YciI family protein [Herbihabitans rhizosphaerae]RZS37751.1 hypothetical protein EV193_105309 [Herbihabitans rhizosphaerae]